MTAGLNQTVRELQQLLQAVSRQLAKGQEGVRPIATLYLQPNKTIWYPNPEAWPFYIFLFPSGGWQRSAQGIVRGGQTPMQPPWLHYRDHLWPSVSSLPPSHHTVTPSPPVPKSLSPHLYCRQPPAEVLTNHSQAHCRPWGSRQRFLLIPNTPDTVPKRTTSLPPHSSSSTA